MSVSLAVNGVISLLLAVGIVFMCYHHNASLSPQRKSIILLLLGSISYAAFLATNFKHRQFFWQHGDKHDALLQRLLFKEDCKFKQYLKYPNILEIPRKHLDDFYTRNYWALQGAAERQHEPRLILYKSAKDEGASYFVRELAERSCHMQIPLIYLKLSSEVISEQHFLNNLDIDSFQILKAGLCKHSGIEINLTGQSFHTLQKAQYLHPFLLIDDFENILATPAAPTFGQQDSWGRRRNELLMRKIIRQLIGHCKVNMILNTESQDAIYKLLEVWSDTDPVGSGIAHKFPFQLRQWSSPSQYDLYQLILTQTGGESLIKSRHFEAFSKQEKYDFKAISAFLNRTEQIFTQSNF